MDDSSFNNWNDSLIKTITQSRQAYGGYRIGVSAIPETACKVSILIIFISSKYSNSCFNICIVINAITLA